MKTIYNGIEVEGTPDEIKNLLGTSYKPKRVYKFKRKFVMTEEHKNRLRKGIKNYWRAKNKGK